MLDIISFADSCIYLSGLLNKQDNPHAGYERAPYAAEWCECWASDSILLLSCKEFSLLGHVRKLLVSEAG